MAYRSRSQRIFSQLVVKIKIVVANQQVLRVRVAVFYCLLQVLQGLSLD